ncbi:pre-mRNA-splicing factor CWC25 homolog [Argonauta hians]
MDADEKKKILEIMKNKTEESNLNWMYKGVEPDMNDYLMGKKIDQYVEKKSDSSSTDKFNSNFATRIKANVAMDPATQMREDPLFQMRKQEEEARRRILDNPIKMKQIEKMLKSQKQSHKSKKHKKSKKKKKKHHKSDSSSSSESADELVKKYLAIVQKKNQDSSGEQEHNQTNKSLHYGLIKSSSSHVSTERAPPSSLPASKSLHGSASQRADRDKQDRFKAKSHHSHRDSSSKHSSNPKLSSRDHRQSKSPPSHTRHRSRSPPPKKLSAIEREKKLEEMMANAKWRSDVRAHNVKVYEKECELDEKNTHKGSSSDFLNPMMSEHASQSSVEERIRRNKYNIQRTKLQLNANFTKR